MIEELDEFQLGNVDNFAGSKDQNYSRSMLLMKATSKILDAGCREMKQGFFMEKKDKFGNILRSLSDDTRKAYCESVQTLRDLQTCDFSPDTLKKVKCVEEETLGQRLKLLNEEQKEWLEVAPGNRGFLIKKGLASTPGSFNSNKRFHEQFILFNLKKHRELFQILTAHSKELDFYGTEKFET